MGNKSSKVHNIQASKSVASRPQTIKSKSVASRPQTIKSKGLWAIGKNESFEIGIGSQESISLKRVHKAYSIANIFIGSGYNIYSNAQNTIIGISGTWSYQQNLAPMGTLSPITYFEDNEITLQKICVGLGGKTTFWVSDTQRLFVTGCNDRFQAGIPDIKHIKKPTEIREIRGVVDVQACNYFSIALCNVSNTIIAVWVRRMFLKDVIIPNDVVTLISTFCRTYTRIYITLYDNTAAEEDKLLLSAIQQSAHKWKEFKRLKGVIVSKIKTGFNHCLLLTSLGTVYSYGDNDYGQCGQQITNMDKDAIEMQKMPLMITYFRQYHKITIKDICCGAYFSLVLAQNGKVFAFGKNDYGQLGNAKRTRKGFNENVSTPLMIKALCDCTVTNISCGYYHGYAETDANEHYLWGSNRFNECMTYNGQEYALELNLINPMINRNVKIKAVYLGKHNTLFIVQDKK